MGVSIKTTRVAADTGGGTQDITISSFGTPKAAILIASSGVTDGTAATHVNFSYGFTDGTLERVIQFNDEDGQTAMDNRMVTVSSVVRLDEPGTATPIAEAVFSAWITDGIRINWTTTPSSAFLISVVLFTGSDLSAYVNHVGVGNAGSTPIDITTVGFEPDVVLMAVNDSRAVDGADAGHTRGGWGVGRSDGVGGVTQRAICQYSDAIVSTSDTSQLFHNLGAIVTKFPSSNDDWYGVLSAFDSSGFTITTQGNGNDSDVIYLALAFNDAVGTYVGTYSTPTSTGNAAETGPGFTPQFVMLGSTYAEAHNTDTDHYSTGLSVFDGTNEYSTTIQGESGLTTSNCQSIADDTAIELPDEAGASGITASFVSMDANGFTLNYSAVEANAKTFWCLAIEEEAAAGGIVGPLIGGRLAKNSPLISGRLVR